MTPTGAPLRVGDVVDGRYVIEHAIDAGGVGQVYKVKQKGLEVFRALKVIKAEHAKTTEYTQSFHDEIKILERLTHQHVVKIIDAGDDQGREFLVMEYVNGEHLDKAASCATDESALLTMFEEILDGLEYLHDRKILHSDLKPTNILVEQDDVTQRRHAKIMDLGAAKNLQRYIPPEGQFQLTLGAGELTRLFGTRRYACPELQRDLNTNPLTRQELIELFPYADLYCLGATLAEAVSTKKIQRHVRDELDFLLANPLPILKSNPDLWTYIVGFIRRLLSERDGRDAFRTVHEARQAFLRREAHRSLPVRVPELTDIGATSSICMASGVHYFTPRAYELICHPTFQRLQKLSQLSFVGLVYPDARHSRFSHSLDVYRLAKMAAIRLLRNTTFRLHVTPEDISAFLCAALLHDIGHFPLAHVLEDIAGVRSDFELVKYFLEHRTNERTSLVELLERKWELAASSIEHLVDKRHQSKLSTAGRFLQQLLSGPLDIDKMAYVAKDSHFTGVPFGAGVDVEFLIDSFVALSPQAFSPQVTDVTIGIDSKGIVAATGLITARAALYGRVYWHHTNRAIMAMIKSVATRAFENGPLTFDEYLAETWNLSEYEALRYLVDRLPKTGEMTPTKNPATGILDGSRTLYKRLVSYSYHSGDERIRSIYNAIYDRPADLEQKRMAIVNHIRTNVGIGVQSYEVLLDVPKPNKGEEALSNILVVDRYNQNRLAQLSQVTGVIGCVRDEFSTNVKKARVFISPRLRDHIRSANLYEGIVHHVEEILLG